MFLKFIVTITFLIYIFFCVWKLNAHGKAKPFFLELWKLWGCFDCVFVIAFLCAQTPVQCLIHSTINRCVAALYYLGRGQRRSCPPYCIHRMVRTQPTNTNTRDDEWAMIVLNNSYNRLNICGEELPIDCFIWSSHFYELGTTTITMLQMTKL